MRAISLVEPAMKEIEKYYQTKGSWPTSITFANKTINMNSNGGWNYTTYSNLDNIVAIQYGCNTGPSSTGVYLWIMMNTPGAGPYRNSGLTATAIFVATRNNNGVMERACNGEPNTDLPANCNTDIKVFTGTGGCF